MTSGGSSCWGFTIGRASEPIIPPLGGALALETGDPDTARERLSVGRELAAETGETLSRDRFDALLESSETPFDESFGTSSDEASETLLKTDRSAAGDDSDGHSRGPETDGGG